MKLSKLFTLFGLCLIIIFMIACGSKLNKAELDAEAYFQYAKDLFDNGKYLDAITEFTVIVLKFSGHPIVDDAQYYLAQSHFENDEYLIAIAEYQKLIDDYPESPLAEQSVYKIGLSAYNLSQRAELDQEYTHQAIRHLQNFIEAYSNSELVQDAERRIKELRTKLARKQLLGANIYRKMGIFDSAVIYYNILLEKYYDTPPAEEAIFYKGECLYKLKKYEEAISNYLSYLEKYPEGEHKDDARSKVEEIQGKLNKLEMPDQESD